MTGVAMVNLRSQSGLQVDFCNFSTLYIYIYNSKKLGRKC